MKWNHLPRSGLLADQDPDLMRRWRIIFSERGQFQEEERRKRDSESRNRAASSGGVRRSRRPRR